MFDIIGTLIEVHFLINVKLGKYKQYRRGSEKFKLELIRLKS